MENEQNNNDYEIRAKKISDLNDKFRKKFSGGSVYTTKRVSCMPNLKLNTLMKLVSKFNDFNEDNDPYGEHNFGKIEMDNETFFWKIDYYNWPLTEGSEDPTNPEITHRVLTIMYADEY